MANVIAMRAKYWFLLRNCSKSEKKKNKKTRQNSCAIHQYCDNGYMENLIFPVKLCWFSSFNCFALPSGTQATRAVLYTHTEYCLPFCVIKLSLSLVQFWMCSMVLVLLCFPFNHVSYFFLFLFFYQSKRMCTDFREIFVLFSICTIL